MSRAGKANFKEGRAHEAGRKLAENGAVEAKSVPFC